MKLKNVIEIHKECLNDIADGLEVYAKYKTYKSYNSLNVAAVKEELNLIKSNSFIRLAKDSEALTRAYELCKKLGDMFDRLTVDPEMKGSGDTKLDIARRWAYKFKDPDIKKSLDWIVAEETYQKEKEAKEKAEAKGMYFPKDGDTVIRPGEEWNPVPKRVFRKPAGI